MGVWIKYPFTKKDSLPFVKTVLKLLGVLNMKDHEFDEWFDEQLPDSLGG